MSSAECCSFRLGLNALTDTRAQTSTQACSSGCWFARIMRHVWPPIDWFYVRLLCLITCNPPVSHITAVAHSPMRLVCTLEWSHSDHCSVCLTHIKEWLKTFIRRPSLADVFRFFNIWRTNSIQVLKSFKSAWFFCRFLFCSSKHVLEIYLKNGLGTGRFLSETGSLWEQSKQKLKTKQTAVVPKKRSSTSWHWDRAPLHWGCQRHDIC